MERINRDRVLRLWSLILRTKGKSKYKKDYPRVLFFKRNTKNSNCGEYTNYDNTIKIWWKEHDDLLDLAKTMLHEYTHYLQFWSWYIRYKNKYSYTLNPYEIQAKNSEESAQEFLNLTRDPIWDNLVNKDKKLLFIYRKISKSIEIE